MKNKNNLKYTFNHSVPIIGDMRQLFNPPLYIIEPYNIISQQIIRLLHLKHYNNKKGLIKLKHIHTIYIKMYMLFFKTNDSRLVVLIKKL